MKRFGMLFAMAFGLVFATSAFAADKKIEKTWKAKCSSCHGMDGKAATEKGKKMKIADFSTEDFQKKSDDDLKKVINEGVKKEEGGVTKEMDPYKEELSAEQIDGLVAFIRGLKK